MFIIVFVLKVLHFDTFALVSCLCSAQLRFANHFSKRKTGKKKASNQGGQWQKPKGNGISPEGWQGKKIIRRSHLIALPLCRSLLVELCVADRRILAAFLPVALWKIIL
jgi:hypothetical protein